MFKFTFLLVVSFFCFGLGANAQNLVSNPFKNKIRANVWYFGHSSVPFAKDAPGLDFTNGSPTVKNDGNDLGDGCSSISDTTGLLQFYAINLAAFDRNHDTLANGSGLIGDSWKATSQGSLMVPKPDSKDTIYLFTVNRGESARYHIVDMSLNGGLGSIVKKNIFLRGMPKVQMTGKMAAVHHCNGKDVWVMFHENQSNRFSAFLVTSNGVDTNEVISPVGLIPNNSACNYGDMKFSPNGKKLVITYADDSTWSNGPTPSQLFDFDNSTGKVSNSLTLPKEGAERGCSFSPDNQKLYIGTTDKNFVQYNLSSSDSSQIINSRTLLFSCTLCAWGSMQLALDGKIYVARSGSDHGDSLSVIQTPNSLGLASNFAYNGLSLKTSYGALGLANLIESYFSDISDYPCISAIIEKPVFSEFIKVFPNPFEHSFSISIENNNLVIQSIKMIDILGRQERINISYLNNDKLIHIDSENPTQSTYFILIEGTVNRKFFKKSIIIHAKN